MTIDRWLLGLLGLFCFCMPAVQAQEGPLIAPGMEVAPVNTYPNENYYIALQHYRDGELGPAALALDLALGRTRKQVSGRWLDAIPVLAMTAEVLYQAGDLSGAVTNIDAALEIAIRHRGWLQALTWNDLASGAARQPDPASAWAAPNIPGVLPLPNRISFASGDVDMSATMQRGGVMESARLTRIDAVEVMRGLAIALYRRGVIFGQISGEFEVANQTLQAILYPPGLQLPAGRALIGSMRGCGKFAAGDGEGLASDVSKSAMVGAAAHPLTPVVLLAAARQQASGDQPAAALKLALQSARAASALGQPEWVGEALALAAGCVDPQAAPALQASASAAAGAHQRRGRLASAGALVAACDAALTAGDQAAATNLLGQLSGVLGQRGRQHPRMAAHGEYLRALVAAAGGAALGDGSGAIDEPLSRVMNFALSGGVPLRRGGAARRGRDAPSTPRLFQLVFVTADAQTRGAGGRAAEQRLEAFTREPAEGVWRNDPVDAIAYLSFDRTSQLAGLIGSAIKRGTSENVLVHGDSLLRARFLTALPLGGRVQQVRTLVSSDRELLTEEAIDYLQDPPPRIRRLVELLGRARGDQDGQQEGQPAAQPRQLESLASAVALSRGVLPSTAPRPIVDSNDLKRLPARHGLLTFINVGSNTIVLLAKGQQVETWLAPAGRQLSGDVIKVLRGIGVGGRASSMRLDDDSWRQDATVLRGKLIPDEKLPLLDDLDHLVVVPDGPLWYLPMELLPWGDTAAGLLNDRLSIRYAPTPGLALYRHAAGVNPELRIGQVSQLFFAPKDRELNQRLVREVADSVERHQQLTGKEPLPSNRLGDSVGLLAVLGVVNPNLGSPLATGVALYDTASSGSLAAWNRLSARPPAGIFLPGYRTAVAAGQSGSGAELFMTITALHLAGVRDVVISRWPVGGESTAMLAKEFFQELPFEGADASWQRAVKTLRRAHLNPTTEPLLGSREQRRDELGGDHPLFWAGYINATAPLPPQQRIDVAGD